MKLFEYVIIDRAGEVPVLVGGDEPKLIFAADEGTAKEIIKKEHVDFAESAVEIRVREF